MDRDDRQSRHRKAVRGLRHRFNAKIGMATPAGFRTSDLQLRRLLLYPLSYGAIRFLLCAFSVLPAIARHLARHLARRLACRLARRFGRTHRSRLARF